MRTPNTKCVICGKPLYRRPSDTISSNFVCCVSCRGEAYRKYPNNKSLNNLLLGRVKGTNHLEGIPKSDRFKKVLSVKIKEWCKNNPEKAKERALCHKGENHHLWNNGSSIFNQIIRRLQELRNWQNKVKDRDGRKCTNCGSCENLESHHITELADLLVKYQIKSIEEARNCNGLWEVENGITLCQSCHYEKHNRTRRTILSNAA